MPNLCYACASRVLACLMLACALVLPSFARAQQPAPIPALSAPVIDTTGTLDAEAIARLEQQALALQQRKGSQLQILMVPSTQPEDIAAYAQRAFDQWALGRDKVDDGVLVVVAKDDRKVRIHTGYGLEGAIPDITAGRVIQEYMVPKFRNNDYAGGIADASAALTKLIDGEPLPEPMSPHSATAGGADWLGQIFLVFFAAIFARSFFGGLPKLLRMPISALVTGGIVWFFTAPLWVVALAAFFGFIVGAITTSHGRYAKHSSWGGYGGGGWGGSSGSGGGWSSGGGGGWSGGGGSSGGGGASGSW